MSETPTEIPAGFRLEHDTMGDVLVPADARYRAQTQRAVQNFAISGTRLHPRHVAALAEIKRAAALANAELGVLPQDVAGAVVAAAEEVAAGDWADQFPVDVFQTGSGTSSNMNVNEVLATLATERLGRPVHPNDHVNASQSSNDVFPASIHVAAAQAVLTVQQLGCSAPVHGVTTASRIESIPGSPNVVPSDVRLHAEMRSIDGEWLSRTKVDIAEQIAANAQAIGVDVEVDWSTDNRIDKMAPTMQDAIARSAERLGHEWMSVPSGATHEAVHRATLCPTGMIFVPSQGGRSHCPDEFSQLGDIVGGIETLAATLVELDRAG